MVKKKDATARIVCMELVKKEYIYVAIGSAVVGFFMCYLYFYFKSETASRIEKYAEQKFMSSKRIINNDKKNTIKRTIVRKKNGEEIIKEIIQNTDNSIITQDVNKKEVIEVTKIENKSHYSLGVKYSLDSIKSLPTKFSYEHLQIELGARLGSFPLFLVSEYDIFTQRLSFGFRFEF